MIKDYDASSIYNCDETALFYRMLPEYTLDHLGEKTYGLTKSKERLTILLCCNCDGNDKLIPFVIGKYLKPRPLKDVKVLPVQYDKSSNAWMTNVLFNKWLEYLNSRMSKKNKKILLFLDSFTGHAVKVNLSHVRVEFFDIKKIFLTLTVLFRIIKTRLLCLKINRPGHMILTVLYCNALFIYMHYIKYHLKYF